MALTASSASAQGIEISDEPSGDHCNPCVAVHVVNTSSAILSVHLFGIEFTDSVCDTEFDAVVYEDGTGELVNQLLTGPGCGREPCPSTPWPVAGREDAPGLELVEARFCIQPVGGGDQLNCSIDAGAEGDGGHSYSFHADDAPCHGAGESPAEVSGEWAIETGGNQVSASH